MDIMLKKVNEETVTITLEEVVITLDHNAFCLLNDVINCGMARGFCVDMGKAYIITNFNTKEPILGAVVNTVESKLLYFDRNDYLSELAQYVIDESKQKQLVD